MGGLVSYSVPLYQLFCRVTGYGGTTQVATGPASQILDRTITIRFNADVNPQLPWRFEPAQGPVTVRVGEPMLAFYRASSNSDVPVTGTAVFNVTPAKAGLYFDKIDCFCFTEQTLLPGQVADLPVQFFIDPAIVKDRNLDDVSTITLSYSFFKAPDQSAADRLRKQAGPPALN
jgi:cytochrome c oxidase assembly protein subunit 11